jgi:hypothetical protein
MQEQASLCDVRLELQLSVEALRRPDLWCRDNAQTYRHEHLAACFSC